MNYLIYGTNVSQSRNFLYHLKSKRPDAQISVYTAEKALQISELANKLLTTNLFTNKRVVVLEFNSEPKIKQENLKFLETPSETQIIIWVGTNLKKTNPLLRFCQKNENFTVKPFNKRENEHLYKFLDSLSNREPKALILLKQILETKEYDLAFITASIGNHLQRVLAYKLNCNFTKSFHPYVSRKIKSQEKYFQTSELEFFLKKLYEIDVKIKRGTLNAENYLFSFVLKITGNV